MSSRSRPRASHNQDADEERRLWKEIKDRAQKADEMVARSDAIGHEILQVETQQAALIDAGKPSDALLDDSLERLYRENLKLCEEIQQILTGAATDMNLLDSINILAGLREASSAEQASAALAAAAPPPTTQRVASNKRDRSKKSGAKVSIPAAPPVEESTLPEEASAAPSPRVGNRLNPKEKTSRAGSIPTTREASVKIEDGAESIASSVETAPSAVSKFETQASATPVPPGGRVTGRITFKTSDLVFYRHRDRTSEGEGILCCVTAVIGEGKQRRYEIQDVDTESSNNATTGPGGKVPAVANPFGTSAGSTSFRASINSLMQIPEAGDNVRLPDLTKGKQVFALYPETTTFYRGEVSGPWKAKEGVESVQVKFEGEMENIESQSVERRYVLPEK